MSLGLGDADASARKVSRILFHLMLENPSFTKKMNQFRDELDQNILKHLQLDSSTAQELNALKNLASALKASEQTVALLKQDSGTIDTATIPNEFESLEEMMQFDDEPVMKKVTAARPKFPERRLSVAGAQRITPGNSSLLGAREESADAKLSKTSSL